MNAKTLIIVMAYCTQIYRSNGHARLMNPVARTSAWRKWPSMFPAEYSDNQMFCGGVDVQWNQNGGKCGICGENYAAPKKWERGSVNYRNLLVAKYSSGQQIEAVVDVDFLEILIIHRYHDQKILIILILLKSGHG